MRTNGDPNGIRTRVSAVKGRCPNRWTIGSFLGKEMRVFRCVPTVGKEFLEYYCAPSFHTAWSSAFPASWPKREAGMPLMLVIAICPSLILTVLARERRTMLPIVCSGFCIPERSGRIDGRGLRHTAEPVPIHINPGNLIWPCFLELERIVITDPGRQTRPMELEGFQPTVGKEARFF